MDTHAQISRYCTQIAQDVAEAAGQVSLGLTTPEQATKLASLEKQIASAKESRVKFQQDADAAEKVFKEADAKLTRVVTRIHTLETERYYLRKEIDPTKKLPLPIRQ